MTLFDDTPFDGSLRQRALEAHQRLIEAYGERPRTPRREPMHELVSTMLSHRTTEADEARAYTRMRERFPTWRQTRDAPLAALIDAISPARFPGSKAPNIQKTLTRIIDERGEASIDFLADLPPEEGLAWLISRTCRRCSGLAVTGISSEGQDPGPRIFRTLPCLTVAAFPLLAYDSTIWRWTRGSIRPTSIVGPRLAHRLSHGPDLSPLPRRLDLIKKIKELLDSQPTIASSITSMIYAMGNTEV